MSIARLSSDGRDCVTIAATSCLLLVFLAILFWDRGTTLELKQPLLGTAMTAGALSGGGAGLWHWFRPREDLPRIPAWNLRHDSPGRWVLRGVGGALLLAGLCCVMAYMLLNVLAQHLPGAVTMNAARLEGLKRGGSRERCVMYAEFSRGTSGRLRSCVESIWAAPLLQENIQLGTAVQLQIEENTVGWVLVSITASGAVAANGATRLWRDYESTPYLYFETWHVQEMLDVIRDQNHALRYSVCGDEKIHIPDRLTGAL